MEFSGFGSSLRIARGPYNQLILCIAGTDLAAKAFVCSIQGIEMLARIGRRVEIGQNLHVDKHETFLRC